MNPPPNPALLTPIHFKTDPGAPWPDREKAFYLLSRDGLFFCRNTPFFRSCVPARQFPGELASQEPFLEINYPRIPRQLLEQIVGFFDIIGERHGSEAIVLLVWNQTTQCVEPIVPGQIGYVSTTASGYRYPVDLDYHIPTVPSNCTVIGDIHSHVDGPAYASHTDQTDETHQPGLHLVVGRILDEPPQFTAEAVADGCRFRIHDFSRVAEGYHTRQKDAVPDAWLSQVTVKPSHTKRWSS